MPDPLTIRHITVRECRQRDERRGRYTTGDLDPEELVWLVVAISAGQQTGYGECIPTSIYYEPGHIGRSNIDDWTELLKLCQSLMGQDARRLGRLVPMDAQSDDANSIKDTVDFALHDLVGRRLGVPVSTLLGGVGRPWVYSIPVIHVRAPEEMAEQAAEDHRRFGTTHFKLKPIGNFEADVETLQRMHEKMGSDVRYYMDANYALQIAEPDEIVLYLNELHKLGLEVYEDPIDADFATYRYIRERTPVRIMLDEKARTPQAVLDIIREQAADQINVHANWAGGFGPALRKAQLAALAGLPTMIGSTVYLGPGSAAYQTLASVLPLAAPCEQQFSATRGRLSAIASPYELRDGKYHIPDAPGLGVEVDTDLLDDLTVRQEVLNS